MSGDEELGQDVLPSLCTLVGARATRSLGRISLG